MSIDPSGIPAKVETWRVWFRTRFMGHPLTAFAIGAAVGALVVWIL